jgi:hypothetical protein
VSRLLFDTTFLIDAEGSGDALDASIDDDDVAIAAITVAEMRMGVLLASGKTRAARQDFLNNVLEVIPIVGYDRPLPNSTQSCSSSPQSARGTAWSARPGDCRDRKSRIPDDRERP